VALTLDNPAWWCAFSFATQAKTAVQVDLVPVSDQHQPPVFIPTRELVTLCPWFVSLYDNYHLRFEESWRDTVSLLGAPSVKGARQSDVADLLEPLEKAMGGTVVVDSATGEFYLNMPGEGKMEMPLVAEGLRKMAMLARLISTGVLLEKGYLFWDEPETNLNPKLIKVLAASIVHLCSRGVQVFLATHSYFLLKELALLSRQTQVAQRYIGLNVSGQAGTVTVQQADALAELENIVALDEELAQYDRDLQGLAHG
jgi:hypothetical protein